MPARRFLTNSVPRPTSPRGPGLDLTLGLLAVTLFFLAGGAVAYLNTRTLAHSTEQIAHTHGVILALEDILSLMKDAETGQRGYVITGDEKYLEPYSAAVAHIDERLRALEKQSADNPTQADRIPTIREQARAKLNELAETIQLRRTQGFEAAHQVVVTDRGKAAMDLLRRQVDLMEQTERELRAQRLREMDDAFRVTTVSGLLTTLLGVGLSLMVTHLVRRAVSERRRQEWQQSGLVGLAQALAGDKRVEVLAENALKFLTEYLGAQAAAFYTRQGDKFRRAATFGVPAGEGTPEEIGPGDGLLAQAVRDGQPVVLADLPPGYLTVGSALGRGLPRSLFIAPAAADDVVVAVMEFGFFGAVPATTRELLDQASGLIGVAVRSANYRAHLQDLLEETQRQSEELQAQGEELRVSNEELEEQGRALKESHARLEQQQAELEQTNEQLEEQAQILESQKDELSRTSLVLKAQARDLEQASRYKSDFLANMSHELRTPLNSSLILAKLLADNPQGNLTEEQVRYADTIRSAGNDLLALINDILDLSKIEAGHVEVQPGPVLLTDLTSDLGRTFDPLAQQKGLTFRTQVAPNAPEAIETDRQRLEQVLKNLLSNAVKFTDRGEVVLDIRPTVDGRIVFAVTDTGIGIAPGQQQVVFEAFRQADGTINRKYGGTGLGLSISRELTALLGGEIHLVSEPGRGSTFSVTLPLVYDPTKNRSRKLSPAPPPVDLPAAAPAPPAEPLPPPLPRPRLPDDRERLTANSRAILVVEDDLSFARILYDLAHELNFQCLIATTAEEGFAMAAQYRPSAVLLDVGLPDHSGLSVLDRLKHDARTRHVPVHVVSAHDQAQTALSLGAVGYLLKPVKREALADALKRIEARLVQPLRRVLVVEDDPTQLDSVRQLLHAHAVDTVGAGSAAECLDRLRAETFDCMVLDLTLPDASGYSLLETLSREDAYSFPPVIVYTGRDLSADEEQRLRRYSKSIIIKGAKSPERLLDEVTLFLHQVVSDLPPESQKMLEKARGRDAALEGRRILVVEDDVRNVFALSSILEPRGARVEIARNGREALDALDRAQADGGVDLVLMDVMMPEMDGLTAAREIRKRPEWKRLPVIMLTAKAMKDDQEQCIAAGANDYMAKPLDVEKLLSLVRVWMPR